MEFRVLPLRSLTSRSRSDNGNQQRMIRALKNIVKEVWPTDIVLWDHDDDPDMDRAAVEPALYTGEKVRGRGRLCRNGAVDVMVRNKEQSTVRLLVEYEPSLDPKKLWGDVGAALDSDRHVPSYVYCRDTSNTDEVSSYFLNGTPLVIVTVCSDQKREQLESIGRRVRDRFRLPTPNLRDVIICAGSTENEVLRTFRQVVTTLRVGQ